VHFPNLPCQFHLASSLSHSFHLRQRLGQDGEGVVRVALPRARFSEQGTVDDGTDDGPDCREVRDAPASRRDAGPRFAATTDRVSFGDLGDRGLVGQCVLAAEPERLGERAVANSPRWYYVIPALNMSRDLTTDVASILPPRHQARSPLALAGQTVSGLSGTANGHSVVENTTRTKCVVVTVPLEAWL
jgi:hypothetical protein